MHIDYQIDDEHKLLIITIAGEVDEDNLVDALKYYQDAIQSIPEYAGYNEMIVFTESSSIKLKAFGVKRIAGLAATTDGKQGHDKLAIAVYSPIAFTLVKMYKAYRKLINPSGKKIQVFRKIKPAIHWASKVD